MEEDLKTATEATDDMIDDAGNKISEETIDNTELQNSEETSELTAYEEEDNEDANISAYSLIGGDFLRNKIFVNQIGFTMYIVFLFVLYTWNRYAFQDDTLLEDALRKELKDIKYNVLTQSSELMNYMRQSNVEEAIKHSEDSLLKTSVTAPFLLREGNAPAKTDEDNISLEESDVNEDGN